MYLWFSSRVSIFLTSNFYNADDIHLPSGQQSRSKYPLRSSPLNNIWRRLSDDQRSLGLLNSYEFSSDQFSWRVFQTRWGKFQTPTRSLCAPQCSLRPGVGCM